MVFCNTSRITDKRLTHRQIKVALRETFSVHTIKGEGIVAFAVLLGFAVILQVLGGAYTSGFGGYPD